MKNLTVLAVTAICICVLAVTADAGNLNPSWGPQSGSGMYTLSEVYYYLTEGTEGSIADSFQEPSAGPGSTTVDTKVIYDDIKAEFDGCDAVPGDVLSGATFFSTDTSAWGPRSGTIAIRNWTADTTAYDAGYYAQTDLNVVDWDLAAGNIKSGETIFGVVGSYPLKGLPKTGQFTSYTNYDDAWYANPAGDDIGNPQGEGTWSGYTADGGRFSLQTISGDVVVTDSATGLIWASDGNQAGCYNGGTRTWSQAITWARDLSFANQTDWRLPNSLELHTIVDQSTVNPAINQTFFPNTQINYYWSSTTYAGYTPGAWRVVFTVGRVDCYDKTSIYSVRAVRGGE